MVESDGQKARLADDSSLQGRKRRRHDALKVSVEAKIATEPSALADNSLAMQRLFVNESQLFAFMHQVNEVYLDHLQQPPPFARYILLGLQSTGKSTQVERLLKFPMNIVAEGTGTRCPLYITCLQDSNTKTAECELTGCERCASEGNPVGLQDVFRCVTKHNKEHCDGFSSSPLRLKVKSKDVQNMFFVDLPGIITTKGQGSDNRKEIKAILQTEIKVPNTKLLVLLEPKEFSTNSIVDFLDETLGPRDTWIGQTLFLMTKFDLRIGDSKTGGKTNQFLDEYWKNGVKPFMVITPTMQRSADSMSSEEQYEERKNLLDDSERFEREKFDEWEKCMADAFAADNRAEMFHNKFSPFVGFTRATNEMNRLLLEDTRARLPQVLHDIANKRDQAKSELDSLKEIAQFLKEDEIQIKMAEVLNLLINQIVAYLNGSLQVAHKLPEQHQTLNEEIEGEEESDWTNRDLNHLTAAEEEWREHMTKMAESKSWPKSAQCESKLLGGKQYQRALGFFKAVMIDRLPDPSHLRPHVASALGALRGGLNREDWEHAAVEIIKTSVRSVSEAGINFFVKHVLYIFRRLLHVALEDLKKGEKCSATLNHLPTHLEDWIIEKYDEMLWDIGKEAVKQCQMSMEPFYSTVNPAISPMGGCAQHTVSLKAGWSQFRSHLESHGVQKLYHFTDKKNWQMIQQLGGLYSWSWLVHHGHNVPSPGGNQWSRNADTMRGIEDFVHLSFCPQHPMLLCAQNDGRLEDCILLAVDPVVATWDSTLFSDRDATTKDAQTGSSLTDLQRIDIEAAKASRAEAQNLLPPRDDYHKAEVMVKTHIPLEYLKVAADLPKQGGGVLDRNSDSLDFEQGPASAKSSMRECSEHDSLMRVAFLPAARSKMICQEEVDVILSKSYEYIVALFRHILITLEFQFNHFLFVGFKEKLPTSMGFKLAASTDWKALARPDEESMRRIADLEQQVQALSVALATVRKIQASAPAPR